MLKKNSQLNIDPRKPFESDALERQQAIELLTRLVQTTNQPFVLSVEAPFGFGKTTFLHLWKAHLQLEGHICLHFSAWENDFVEDPLIAFLGEMDREIEAVGKNDEGFPLAEDWKKVSRLGGKLFRKALPAVVQIVTAGALKSKDMIELAGSLAEHGEELAKDAGEFTRKKLEEYESSRKTILGFRDALESFAKKLASVENKKKPIVFFIDELDRCRPDFAVALLERIKHLFQVDGFFFVLGLDRNQLCHSVRTLYGQGMDAEGYLRRFMDLQYSLPEPEPDRFARLLYGRFKMDEIFDFGFGRTQGTEFLLNYFPKFAKEFKLSLRTQEQCFTEMNLALRTMLQGNSIELIALSFLVCLRASDREKYKLMIAGRIDPREIGKLVINPELSETGIAEAVAMMACPNPGRQKMLYEQTVARNNANAPEEGRDSARRAARAYDQLRSAIQPGGHSMIEHLEMLTKFRGF
jgi:hypothetical protein